MSPTINIVIPNESLLNQSDIEIQQMIDNRDIYQKQIYNFYNLINHNKDKIKQIEKELYKKCDHDWIRDECANFDDRCKYICSKCSLYRSDYLYN